MAIKEFMVCVGVVILRFTMPEAKRPFKVPLGITIPLLGVAGCLWLMMSLSSSAWFLTLVALAIGLAIYFTYGMHNSIMKDPVALESLDIEAPPLAMVGH
jgi:APA family basic amino acid/polyamine antiporter